MKLKSFDKLDLTGKRVLLRVDFNVPMDGDTVTDDTRIRRSLPTIQSLLECGASVLLLSHRGRPKGHDQSLSLKPLIPVLESLLGQQVGFLADFDNSTTPTDRIILGENLRFWPGEEAGAAEFAGTLAQHGEVFVNDAFSACHRAHASIAELPKLLPSAAGKSLTTEVDAISKALENPQRPVTAIVGGAKVDSKIAVLKNLVKKVDTLIIGGGMANTFLAARGDEIGASFYQPDQLETAREILELAEQNQCDISLPVDAMVAPGMDEGDKAELKRIVEIQPQDAIFDIGLRTVWLAKTTIELSRTLVWNGPFGVFEKPPFHQGTEAVAKVAACETLEEGLLSVAGGGDTVAALNQADVADQLSFVSTAGGAFLEWMEGKDLPGLKALQA